MQTSKTTLVLDVRCCNDAHVLMSSQLHQNDSSHAYEVVFGGHSNSWLILRRGSVGQSSYEDTAVIEGLVSCDELRTFWVSWENGNVQAGSGGIPFSHTYLGWQDPNPLNVEYLAFSTGWGSEGDFQIRHDGGEMTSPSNLDGIPNIHLHFAI